MILINLRPKEKLKLSGPATIMSKPDRSSRIIVDAPNETRVTKILADGSILAPSPREPKRGGVA